MDHNQNNVVADPRELERAQTCWANFTEMSKWGILAVVVILVLMAIFLV